MSATATRTKTTPLSRVKVSESSSLKACAFWKMFLEKIPKKTLLFSGLIFSDQKLRENSAGGLFSSMGHAKILVLPEKFSDSEDCIFVEDDESLALLVHECSHFLHFVDKAWTTPQILDTMSADADSSDVLMYEVEAWFRSLSLARAVGLSLEVVNQTNSKNCRAVISTSGGRVPKFLSEAPFLMDSPERGSRRTRT